MKVYAIVPVKRLATSKSRLASILTLENRERLTLAMLTDVLTAIHDSSIQEIVVVGSNLSVCQLAMTAGVTYINEKARGLNRAIEVSIKWCMERGADSILVLPADIPLLSPADIERIIDLGEYADSIAVLSPSNSGGTNALYLRPPSLMPVRYGPGSFKRHIRCARDRGIPVKIYYSSSIAFDVDSQEDLQKLLTKLNTTLSGQFVTEVLSRN
jgi:2-phospho-L-lactate guanylyltransferase